MPNVKWNEAVTNSGPGPWTSALMTTGSLEFGAVQCGYRYGVGFPTPAGAPYSVYCFQISPQVCASYQWACWWWAMKVLAAIWTRRTEMMLPAYTQVRIIHARCWSICKRLIL